MTTMTIAVNARMLLKDRLDGTGWFAYQTLRRIVLTHPDVHFVFLFDRPYSPEFIFAKNVAAHVIAPPTRHPFLIYWWFQVAVKRWLNKNKPDLFLSPDGFLSLGASCRQLTVIHDINFKHYPTDMPFLMSKLYNHYFPKFALAATRIATVSEFTKQDVAKEYNVNPAKIDVVYNGVDENYKPANESARQITRDAFTNGKKYFLFVGSIHPRKNIVRLLEAFDVFKKETGSDIKLVIAGAWFWGKSEIRRVQNELKYGNDVIFTGRVAIETLYELMAGAFALTYVPYFEGFGVPLLEAMRSEVPIIAANTTSLPEVAGRAALYVDPFDVNAIKKAMTDVARDPDLRSTLIEFGKKQCQKFSWDQSTDQLWKCIEKTLLV